MKGGEVTDTAEDSVKKASIWQDFRYKPKCPKRKPGDVNEAVFTLCLMKVPTSGGNTANLHPHRGSASLLPTSPSGGVSLCSLSCFPTCNEVRTFCWIFPKGAVFKNTTVHNCCSRHVPELFLPDILWTFFSDSCLKTAWVCYCHLLFGGIVRNHWQELVSSHACVSERTRH